jgi:hypothetical protein
MSAREIIAQIEALPESEKAVVVDYVHKLEGDLADEAKSVNPVIANESAEKIFNNYDNLFRKLAK